MYRLFLATFGLILTPALLIGQVLQGMVTDQDGVGLPTAYIYTPSGERHAHTDELGRFTLNGVAAGDTILTTYLGYESNRLILEASHFSGEITIPLIEKYVELGQVVVTNEVDALNSLTDVDLRINPVNSSQEILRKVPGLIIGQHAGGGKAEQIFLRGFDIDHGTDINITVDGIPVNMVSHAHGQGYADLHFLIPETIERIDFGKGPYSADKGNFTTAGYVNFQTKEKLNGSSIGLTAGQFNTFRTLALLDLLGPATDRNAYIATEYLVSDGPFESSQHFNRLNLMGKYSALLNNADKFTLQFSHFDSEWDASGQIPQRAVDAGLIGRFGAIDDTEGGSTSRNNVAAGLTKLIDRNTFVKTRAYFSAYDFELYSNFTFFLSDPVNGDQIRQRESRQLYGLESVFNRYSTFRGSELDVQAGIGYRTDRVAGNELSRTANRKTTLSRIARGDISESNFYSFVRADIELGKFLINPSLRLDYFSFAYVDRLDSLYQRQAESKFFLSPKLNFTYNPGPHWQLFLKTGVGFHSNDTRVVVAQDGREVLPAAYGADLGAIWKPARQLFVNASLWYLLLEQEFVYVGDEGVVEPSGRSRRLGVDLSLRYQPKPWLFLYTDLNYAFARSIDEAEGADYIPLAPDLTATGGVTVRHPSGFAGGFQFRYLDDRPANEDNSIVADGYFITDVNLDYAFKQFNLGVAVENVFNSAWKETQFATESRLSNEAFGVEEIHFTPGTPFFLKARVEYKF